MKTRYATLLTVVLARVLSAHVAFGEVVDVRLDLPSPGTSQNRFSIRIESDVGSDSDTTDATGYLDVQLDAVFDPSNHAATISGLSFVERTPGTVHFSDMSFSFFFGLLRARTAGVTVTGKTPRPFGGVVDGAFSVEDHRVVLNGGTLTAEGLVSETIDLSVTPMESTSTNGLMGTLAISAPTIDGDEATYTVDLSLPITIDETQVADGQQVRVLGSGTLRGRGFLVRALPPPDDGDGIPADWEVAHGTDPAVDDGGLDPDGDGLSNYGEFVSDTDPGDELSVPVLAVDRRGGGLQFRFHGRASRVYRIEGRGSAGDGSWKTLREFEPAVDGTITLNHLVGEGRSGFFRLRVGLP